MKLVNDTKKNIDVVTNYGIHRCLLERDEDKSWIVTVPGLPGIVTWGKHLVEARRMAKEAIECHIESLAKLAMEHQRGGRARTKITALA